VRRPTLRTVFAVVLAAAGSGAVAQAAWIPAKAVLAQVLIERAWTRAAAGAADARPWPWADTEPVARLSAPAQGERVMVLSGFGGHTFAFGPGHLPGSALPGEPGNCVLAGHRDTHFAFLEELEIGDLLTVERPDGARQDYRVTGAEVVDETETGALDPLETGRGAKALTLVTCYPFDAVVPGGPLRYVVRAEGVSSG